MTDTLSKLLAGQAAGAAGAAASNSSLLTSALALAIQQQQQQQVHAAAAAAAAAMGSGSGGGASDLAGLEGSPGGPPSGSPTHPGSDSDSQKKTCPYCYQQLSWHALSRHIRDMHRAKTGLVTCEFCNKTFRNKNSLGCHKWRFHKDAARDQASKQTADSGLSTGQLSAASQAVAAASLPPSLLAAAAAGGLQTGTPSSIPTPVPVHADFSPIKIPAAGVVPPPAGSPPELPVFPHLAVSSSSKSNEAGKPSVTEAKDL